MRTKRNGLRVLAFIALMAAALFTLAACGAEEAEDLQDVVWPDSEIGKLLPETDAKATSLSFSEDSISATLKMTKGEYRDYVSACKDAGFTKHEESSDSEDFADYSAENEEGYSLSLWYDSDESSCDLSLYEPGYGDDDEDEDEDEEEEEKETSSSDSSDDDVTSDFKKLMDDYEAFVDDYVDFMKKYEDSDDLSAEMVSDYTDMMDKYAKFEKKIDGIDEDSLSSSDYAYYTKVMGRVTEKLADI